MADYDITVSSDLVHDYVHWTMAEDEMLVYSRSSRKTTDFEIHGSSKENREEKGGERERGERRFVHYIL